jgi:hypothetical protein
LASAQICRKSSSEQAFLAELFGRNGRERLSSGSGGWVVVSDMHSFA